jgi:hypothetical protein
MELSHPGRGEVVAAIGAVVMLFALIALSWYDVEEPMIAPVQIDRDPTTALLAQAEELQELPITEGTVPESFGAWKEPGALGTIANLIILAAGLFALTVAGFAVTGARLDASGLVLVVASALALAMVVLRMIVRPEEIPLGTQEVPFEFEAGLKLGIFIALAGALIQLVGALMRLARPGGTPAATAPEPTAPDRAPRSPS